MEPSPDLDRRLAAIEKKLEMTVLDHSDTGIGCLGLILFGLVISMLLNLHDKLDALLEAQGISMDPPAEESSW